jgi:hypothetical protein
MSQRPWPIRGAAQSPCGLRDSRPEKPRRDLLFANESRSGSLACGAPWAHVSIVSDDGEDIAEPSAVGSRRVSLRLAIAVVLGCAVLGLIIGVLYPLRPNIQPAQKAEQPANLMIASAKPVEDPPAAGRPRRSTKLSVQPEQPESVGAGDALPEPHSLAPPVASVSTGSVDRSPSPGASESAVLTASDRQAAARSEPEVHLASQRHRAARAKRLRRVLWRRMRSKPLGASIDTFFASLFPKI